MITLSKSEERLVEALRSLPPATADTLITSQLNDLANGRPIDWSDTWTEEDLADLQRASIASLEEREPATS